MKMIFIILFVCISLGAKELEKVSIQLQWLDQFQFAGYYMAKEKGYYEDVGLDVEIKQFVFGVDVVAEVLSKRATFGVGRSSLIINRSKGEKVVLLSALYQASPLVLVALENSGIKSIKEFDSKKIMGLFDETSIISIQAMLQSQGVTQENLNIIPYDYDINKLINKKIDILSAYRTNQTFKLDKLGIKYRVFDPYDFGFEVYGDLLFTSEEEVLNNRYKVELFRDATLKGWKYAFENIDESINVIQEKYNTQNKSYEALLYEAQESKKLAYLNTTILGKIDKDKIRRSYDMYNLMNLVGHEINLEKFIYQNHTHKHAKLTLEQRNYLSKKQEIKICVVPDILPYSKIEEGKFIGIGAEYIELISTRIDTRFTLVPTTTWSESLAYIKDKKCDILPLVKKTQEIGEYINFTKYFLKSDVVVVTQANEAYIADIKDVQHKNFGVGLGYTNEAELKKKYPNINIVNVVNVKDGLQQVQDGILFGYIGDLSSVAYAIEKDFNHKLKISGYVGDSINISMGVENNNTILVGILNKAIESISEDELDTILHKWTNIIYAARVDYTLLVKSIFIFFFILFIVLFYLKKQNRLKKESEESKNILQAYVDVMNDGFAVANVETGKFYFCNQEFENMTGYTISELQEKRAEDIHPKESVGYAMKKFEELLEGKILTASSIEVAHKDGTVRLFDVNSSLMTYKDSTYNVASFRDVGEKLKLQKKLELTNKELALKSDEIEQINEGLELKIKDEILRNSKKDKQMLAQSRLAQMGELISMIAHQWRQPLGAIAAASIDMKLKIELDIFDLSKQSGREESSAYFISSLEGIEELTKSLTTTIDDFRDFYKPNKVRRALQIKHPIQKALNIISTSLKTDDIGINEDYYSHKVFPMLDSEVMHVILNIFKNAQDNFKSKEIENKTIDIITRDISQGVEICICDNGGGIPREIMEKIFDPYFSTKYEKNGTGLGLYMSKTIIEKHHYGLLNAVNIEGGVCFTIQLYDGDKL